MVYESILQKKFNKVCRVQYDIDVAGNSSDILIMEILTEISL